MAYEPIRKYGDKDKLPSGDPGKVIYGAELDEEFSGVASDLTSLDEFKEAQLESNQNAYDELVKHGVFICLLYTSPSPRDKRQSRMPSSA